MATKLTIELSVKDLAAGKMQQLVAELNSMGVKSKEVFTRTNSEGRRVAGTLGTINSQFLKLAGGYLGFRGLVRLFSLARQNSEELNEAIGNLSKETGTYMGRLIDFWEGDKIINAASGLVSKLNSEFSKFKPGTLTVGNVLSGTTELTNQAYIDSLMEQLAAIQKKFDTQMSMADMLAEKEKERKIRETLKVFVDAENQKTHSVAARIDAIAAREKYLEDWRKQQADIKANEERERVKNPSLGVANRSLSGNIFAPGTSVAFTMIERQADAGAKAYDNLSDAANEWANKEADATIKVMNEKKRLEEENQRVIEQTIALRRQEFDIMVGNFAVASKSMKEFGRAYQVAAIAQAIIDTYAGAQSAFKAMAGIPIIGPALGTTAAIAAVAAGIARVDMIRQQKFAVGTPFAPGGMSLVGEHGPELVNLPRGAQVFNNRETNNISNGTTYIVNLPQGSSPQTFREISDQLVKMGERGYLNRFMVRSYMHGKRVAGD